MKHNILISTEQVPGSAWRAVAIIGASRMRHGVRVPLTDACYTAAQADVCASSTQRWIRGETTADAVRMLRSMSACEVRS